MLADTFPPVAGIYLGQAVSAVHSYSCLPEIIDPTGGNGQIVKETDKTVTAKIGFMTSLQEDLEMMISIRELLSSTWSSNKSSQPGVTEGQSNGSSQDIPAKECLERQ